MQDMLLESAVLELIKYLTSTTFKNSVSRLYKRIKEKSPGEVIQEVEAFDKQTLDGLSERQAEAITLEYMYLSLLDGKVSETQTLSNLSSLGYTVNPNPLEWLKKRLTELRQWIVDAIQWLRMIGEQLFLSVKEITVEIGITPKVSITFTPRVDRARKQ